VDVPLAPLWRRAKPRVWYLVPSLCGTTAHAAFLTAPRAWTVRRLVTAAAETTSRNVPEMAMAARTRMRHSARCVSRVTSRGSRTEITAAGGAGGNVDRDIIDIDGGRLVGKCCGMVAVVSDSFVAEMRELDIVFDRMKRIGEPCPRNEDRHHSDHCDNTFVAASQEQRAVAENEIKDWSRPDSAARSFVR